MMATAANQSKPVDAATTSDEPAITLSSDSQNVDSKLPIVNGVPASAASDEIENKQLSEIVDDLVNSAEVSISGGSDTEASKTDGVSSKNGDKGHTRTSSTVKKPAIFKAVSVNRTFLGNKGSVSNASPKPGDKPTSASPLSAGQSTGASPSAASAGRPRFVAKSSSGLRDGAKSIAGSNGKAAASPDPSAVWNKNRPPPPPEPKKFTDEELKKYGIHMASRLAPDDALGPGNWADIDEDDEDWNPAEIQWNDGTKVTIPQVDEAPASPTPPPAAELAPAPPVAPPVLREVKPMEKPKSPAPTASPSVKPGVLVSGKGLVLKGAPEKPTLVARPPAPPAPVKSPWATLPPVDKASPAVMDAAPAQLSGRPPIRDGPVAKSSTPPPAKEIAADDFSRSGGPRNPNRELFNSQSGRYEPVTDRRAVGRSETYSRHPAAVLQRPSQSEGPAEPSAAFQTNRTSGQDAPYGRRRGSSNVSGGSGTYLQRLAKPHDQPIAPLEVMNVRRESFTAGSDSPISPRNFSPAGARHPGPWHARTSPRAPFAQPQQPPHLTGTQDSHPPAPMVQAPPPVPREDVIELQTRTMAEKRNLARQRKLDEEAKLEAEKKQRIAAKLAAMGPAPESRSAKQAAAKDEATSTPTLPAATPVTPAPPLSKVPSASQPQPEVKPVLASQKSDGERPTVDPATNGIADGRAGQMPAGSDSNLTEGPDAKPSQSWQGSVPAQNDRFPAWGTGPQPSAKIWGAPNSSNRSLGNGTFTADLGRLPNSYPQQMDQGSGKPRPGPGPIGPPVANKGHGTHPKPIGPPRSNPAEQTQRPAPADERSSRWVNATIAADEKAASESRERLALQKREMEARGVTAEDVRPAYRDSWKPTTLDESGRRVEANERVKTLHGTNWTAAATAEEAKPPQPLALAPTGPASTAQSSTPHVPTVPAQSHKSRFFPSSTDVRSETPASAPLDVSRPHSPSPPPPDTVGHPAFDGDATHPHVALPPSRPVVRLPPSSISAQALIQPLPPAVSTTGAQPFGSPTPHPSKEVVSSPYGQPRGIPGAAGQQRPHGASDWQNRINNLLHDKKPSQHHKAMTVEASSRGTLEPAHTHVHATVSLPAFVVTSGADDYSPTSKGMAEECFEEQEMGSLPQVRLPSTVAEAAWHVTPPAKPFPRRLAVEATSIDRHEDSLATHQIRILFPGMTKAKEFALPMSARSFSNSRRSNRPRTTGPRHPAGPSGPAPRGGGVPGPRSRDASVSYPNDSSNTNISSRRPGSRQGSRSGPGNAGMGLSTGPAIGSTPAPHGRGRGGRGGFRPPVDWSRRGSTPVQT